MKDEHSLLALYSSSCFRFKNAFDIFQSPLDMMNSFDAWVHQ